MEIEEQLEVQKLMAKVLMLETIQTSICTYLATQSFTPETFVGRVFDDAENELRVMAIARNAGMPTSSRSVDLALVYLAETAGSVRSALSRDKSGSLERSRYERE